MLLLYREEYYLVRQEPDGSDNDAWDEWNTALYAAKNIGEIIIAKNRQGRLKTVRARFDAERNCFENLTARN